MDVSQPNYTVTYQDPLRTTSVHLASGQSLITDAPVDNHGLGQAFSPTDLLSTSLAACIMTIMGIAADRDSIDIVSMKADVAKEMAANPRRVAAVTAHIEVELKNATDESAERLRRIALACPVARSLSPDLIQNIHINFHHKS